MADARGNHETFPHLLAIGERAKPSPIFVAIMTDKAHYIHFDPELLELPWIDHLSCLGDLIREHHARREGTLPGFGRIRYYVLHHSADEPDAEEPAFEMGGSLILEFHPRNAPQPGPTRWH